MDIWWEHYDTPLTGHCSVTRMLQFISWNYWFPGVNVLVRDYTKSFHLCQQANVVCHLRYGELTPIQVPDSPWKGLSWDLITGLPVSNGIDLILVFVDRMTKKSHVIPCLKSTFTSEFACLLIFYIIKQYSLLDSMVSDCSSIFMSNF